MPQPKCVIPPYLAKFPNYGLAAQALRNNSKMKKNQQPHIWKCLFCKGYHGQFRDE